MKFKLSAVKRLGYINLHRVLCTVYMYTHARRHLQNAKSLRYLNLTTHIGALRYNTLTG